MKTNEFNQKSVFFKSVKTDASAQINLATSSIFFWRKNLLSLSQKNEFCEGKKVADVEKAVRDYTKGGQKWDVSIFPKDTKGRFCTLSVSKKCPKWGKDIVNVSPEGWEYLQPIPMNLKGVFNAFCKVAAKEIKAFEKEQRALMCEEEKEEKRRQKEIQKAAKIKELKIKELQRALDKGILTEKEFNEKLKAL